MPATAPFRVVPRQKMPITITGTNAEAASENRRQTPWSKFLTASAATKAADKATVSKGELGQDHPLLGRCIALGAAEILGRAPARC